MCAASGRIVGDAVTRIVARAEIPMVWAAGGSYLTWAIEQESLRIRAGGRAAGCTVARPRKCRDGASSERLIPGAVCGWLVLEQEAGNCLG